MPTLTPAELRAVADFLETLDQAAENPDAPNVSITVTSPTVEVSGLTAGNVRYQDGIHVLDITRD